MADKERPLSAVRAENHPALPHVPRTQRDRKDLQREPSHTTVAASSHFLLPCYPHCFQSLMLLGQAPSEVLTKPARPNSLNAAVCRVAYIPFSLHSADGETEAQRGRILARGIPQSWGETLRALTPRSVARLSIPPAAWCLFNPLYGHPT